MLKHFRNCEGIKRNMLYLCKCNKPLSKRLTEAQSMALIAHLKDYIALQRTLWPKEKDCPILARCMALLKEIEGASNV
jgi:hypothetical protein